MLRIENFIELSQGKKEMYIFKLPVEELINNYKISYYNTQTKTGYQRPPQQAHYRKIAQFLAEDADNNILPMSIIAAINRVDVKKNGNVLSINDCVRVVDGQHRIKGIEYLRDSSKKMLNVKFYELIKSYNFPVILLVVNEDDSLDEIDTFININSKGKRVSINLAKELKWKKTRDSLIENPIEINSELKEVISTEITQRLEKDKSSFWYHNITMADEVGNTKPISIGAFSKSLDKIVNYFINKYYAEKKYLTKVEYNKISEIITELIIKTWEATMSIWPKCFEDRTYNIYKGIGVSSLHRLLVGCLENETSDIENIVDDAICIYMKYIKNSNVNYEYWKIGGKFTGLSSEQGYDTIVSIIKNEFDIDDIEDPFFF